MQKKILILTIFILLSSLSYSQSRNKIVKFVKYQIEKYPGIHLQDIYKTCYQDFMGAEHLVSNGNSVLDYINKEVNSMNDDYVPDCLYEKCGINGDFIRIDLNVVKNNTINAKDLSEFFVESATSINKNHNLDTWIEQWSKIEKTIDEMNLNLPNYEAEKQYIRKLFSHGEYACSHSSDYRNAYHPHYRIVSKRVLKNHKIKIENCK